MAIYNEDTEKKDLIEYIKESVKDFGEFNVGEMELDCSPTIESNGNLSHLIEKINKETVGVEVYGGWENSIDQYTLTYEELDEDTLREIQNICQDREEKITEENDFEDENGHVK